MCHAFASPVRHPPHPVRTRHWPGSRSGRGAHSVLEQMLHDRAEKPEPDWREAHPLVAPRGTCHAN